MKTTQTCPSCKRHLHSDANGVLVCINARCAFYSPGVHATPTKREINQQIATTRTALSTVRAVVGAEEEPGDAALVFGELDSAVFELGELIDARTANLVTPTTKEQ